MADAITAMRNPVSAAFMVNKYDDIDGARVNQSTARGKLCFRDSDGRMVLPATQAQANKAVSAVDWAKPLNPGPYFNNGNGLNGTGLYPFSDGTEGAAENSFTMDPNEAFQTPWPAAVAVYEIPPLFYNQPVPSGAMCLVYDGETTVTYASGYYTGLITDFTVGAGVYADWATTTKGNVTAGSFNASGVAIGMVMSRGTFGDQTLTVKLFGTSNAKL